MKIGAFAKKNQVGIDTVRHYIDLGLIIPQRPSSQFEFDLQCQSDFDEIIFFKSLGFTLLEIKNIFIIKRLGKMTSYEQDKYYKNMFTEKYESTKAEIKRLSGEKMRLEQELQRLDTKSENKQLKMGIGLACLQYFRCDICGGPLVLNEAAVEENMVTSGKLKCKCGTEYTIKDGILFVEAGHYSNDQLPDVLSYIRHTDAEYLDHVYKTLEWEVQNINFSELSGKIVLELGSGSGFFLRRIYDELPEDTVYIAVDYDPGRLYFLKDILEKSDGRKNIVFICCDFTRMPLLPHSIDIICDDLGTSNYSFEHSEFLLDLTERYYKADAALLSSYIIFKNFSQDSMIPTDCRPNFRIGAIKKRIEERGFIKQADHISDAVTKGGIYEDYFRQDEKVMTYSFIGKRSG